MKTSIEVDLISGESLPKRTVLRLVEVNKKEILGEVEIDLAKYSHLNEKTEFSFKCKRPEGSRDHMSPADIPKIEFSMKSVLLKKADPLKRQTSVTKSKEILPEKTNADPR